MLSPALRRPTHPFLLWLSSLALVFFIAWADYYTADEFSLAVFYVFPMLWMTQAGGLIPGLLCAAVCSLSWARLDVQMPYQHYLSPYWSWLIKLSFFTIMVVIFNRLQISIANERRAANEDPLTGLRNRRAFFDQAQFELQRARRHQQALALAYLDADNFKALNDSYGHDTGDELLRVIAHVMKQTLRRTDLSGRLGGDEFVVLLTDCDPDSAQDVMSRLKAELLAEMQAHNWPVTFSIGLVIFKDFPDNFDQMLHEADHLMYQVKKQHKNQLAAKVYEQASVTH